MALVLGQVHGHAARVADLGADELQMPFQHEAKAKRSQVGMNAMSVCLHLSHRVGSLKLQMLQRLWCSAAMFINHTPASNRSQASRGPTPTHNRFGARM